MRILTGRAGSGKTQRLFAEMIQNRETRHILIVPELYSHEYERELARQTHNTGGQFCEVLTFRRAAHRVFAEAGGLADTVLSQAGRLLVLFESVRRSADALTVYQDVARRPELLRELLSVIDELKSGAVTGEQVLSASEQVEGSLSAKLRDIGLIDTVYETLTAQELPDPRDELTRMLEKLPQSTLFDGAQVYFDSFAGFTMQEFAIISCLLGKKVPVTVALTYDAAEPELFGTAQTTIHRLRAIAGRNGTSVRMEDCGACRMEKPADLTALESVLLRAGQHNRASDRSSVFLHAASDLFSECEYAAAQILKTIRETRCRYRDVVVTARNFEVYAPALELVFERYGIPVFLSEKHDILQKPVLALVGAALRAVTGGWRYEDVFTYLKTGFANVTPEECDELENYALFWRLRGEKAWREPWARNPEGFSGVITDRGREQLERLNELRERVTQPLLALTRELEQANTAIEYAQAVYSFLERIDAGTCIAARADAQEQAGNLQTAEEYRQLWEILVQALEQLAWVYGDGEMDTGVFVTLLRLVLSEYDVGTIPISMDRVTCGPMERVCRTGTPHVFVLGANDGVLPSACESGGVLTDSDREQLLACEIELTTGEDRAAREQELIYRMLSAPSQTMHLSWLCGGGEGRPSYLVERIRACLTGVPETNEAALMGSYRLECERTRRELASLGAGGDRSPAAQAAYRAGIEHETPIRSTVRGPIRDREMISALYGERIRLTASRVDQFYSCQYAYFLKYGLRAKERRRAAFDAPETGTFLHYVLEHTIREITAREGGAAGCSDQDASKIAHRWVQEYIDSMLGGLESHSARFRYLFRRLVRLLDEMLQNILEELRSSDFVPIDFELGVFPRGDIPPVEVELENGTLELAGKVDRVDGYIQGDKLYVRVMDYKSGTKAFDLSDLWYGLNMQLLIYLFTVQDNGLERYRRRIARSLNEIVPAGALYIPARSVVPDAEREETEDGVRALREKALRRSGLILNDPDVLEAMEHDIVKSGRFLPLTVRKGGTVSSTALTSLEEMGKLAAHIRKTLEDMGRQLLDGSTQAKPYRKGPKDTACTWCPYASVCQFDAKLGDRARYLKKLSQQEFWEQMEG